MMQKVQGLIFAIFCLNRRFPCGTGLCCGNVRSHLLGGSNGLFYVLWIFGYCLDYSFSSKRLFCNVVRL